MSLRALPESKAIPVPRLRPYFATPISLRHDTLAQAYLPLTQRLAHALRRSRHLPTRLHPGSTHRLAGAAVLRQPGCFGRNRRRRQVVVASGRWRGPSGASAWSPGACGRTVRCSGSGPIRPCHTAPDDADEGKADRPPSRAASALRPWPTADCRNPKLHPSAGGNGLRRSEQSALFCKSIRQAIHYVKECVYDAKGHR
jgi:hypothetical protein